MLACVNGKSLLVQLVVAVVLQLLVEQELHAPSCKPKLVRFFESDFPSDRYDLSQLHRGIKNRPSTIKEVEPKLVLVGPPLLDGDVSGHASDGTC